MVTRGTAIIINSLKIIGIIIKKYRTRKLVRKFGTRKNADICPFLEFFLFFS